MTHVWLVMNGYKIISAWEDAADADKEMQRLNAPERERWSSTSEPFSHSVQSWIIFPKKEKR